MSDKPQIIDLRKSDENEEDPDRNPENAMDTESEGDVYENARDDYPDGVEGNEEAGDPDEERKDPSGEARENYSEETEEELEDETDVEMPDAEDADGADEGESTSKSEEEEEKAFSLRDYNLTNKFAEDKGFGDLKEGNLVLVDTPLEGAKVGEVVGKEESWTGTLYVKVDTGANKYDITPYEDEFSEKFIACIDEEGEVTTDLLQRLGKTDVGEVEVGNQVILDVPKAGPVRGTVSHKSETETQGIKCDVNAGAATFTIYEEPSPQQKKEQPMIVGRVQ